MVQAYLNNFSRVWFQEGGPGPSRSRTYHSNWTVGAPSWTRGDITILREPDPDQYGRFIAVGRYRGEPGNPELPLTARYSTQRSDLLRLARGDCDHALHVHMGICENPQDFARGWEKVLILEGASINSWGTGAIGAPTQGDIAPVNEDVPFAGSDLYEVVKLTMAELATTVVNREITSVYVCDAAQCGACGVPSDGCQLVLALEGGISASPGQAATLLYTRDGGGSWTTVPITTLAANERADAVFCTGTQVVVASADSESFHVTTLTDLIAGTQTWQEVTSGFVATKGPTAISSLGATDNWIAGEGGYIYTSDDPASGVTVSHAGSASTADLHDIHAFDSLNVVAVGANNALLNTRNGGGSWSLVVGPAVGVVLNTIWMRGPLEWLVGAANGKLFYTIDGGVAWTEKTFSGSGAGQVRDLVFSTPSVGYMAHSTAAPAGRVLRTIDGGFSWYVLPEGSGSIPANDYVASLAVCDDPNVVYGGGLGDNAVDGFLVKGA